MRFWLTVSCDTRDYFKAREAAEVTNLLKRRGFGEKLSTDRRVALEFAKDIDRKSKEMKVHLD